MTKITYRGYDIEPKPLEASAPLSHGDKAYLIYLNGKFVCQQPSEEFAYKWIDGEKRKQR